MSIRLGSARPGEATWPVEGVGRGAAESVDSYWQDGLAFYEGLSSSSRPVVANGAGLDMVVRDQPDLVIEQVLEMLKR